MKITDLPYYVRLYKASRIASKFYREYEHLARDVAFHPEMGVRLDVYAQSSGANHPVLIFIHGGHWGSFRKTLFAPVALKLLPEKVAVVIPDHAPYPRANYEQMTREVAAVLIWTLENIERHGGDPRRVFIAGHSSGAHLAALAVMDPRFLAACGHTGAEVCGLIAASGVYDLEALYDPERSRGRDRLNREIVGVAGGLEKLAAASPIHYVRADLPPILLIHGDADQTVPVEQAILFHAALQKAGAQSALKIYPGRGHSEILFSALAEERAQIVADIAEFVHRCPG